MANKTAPYIIMDFETGGLNCQINPITEFAAISIDGDTLKQIDEIDILFKVYDENLVYEQEALVSTNISMDMLESKGLDFKTAINKMCEFFKNSNIHTHISNRPVIVGHNIGFDIGFLQHLFSRTNKKLESFIAGKYDFYGNFYPESIDTLRLSKFAWANDEEFKSYKLINCIQKANLELVGAHRAMNDVRATKDLLISHIQKLRSDGGETKQTTRIREYFKF